MASKCKNAVLSALGSKASQLDETIIDYMCGVLEDESLQKDTEELAAVLGPFLLDSGSISNDEEVKAICKSITSDLSSGTTSLASSNGNRPLKSLLSSPINMSQMTLKEVEDKPDWMKQKEQISLVDQDKLKAYEAKREKRLGQRAKKEAHKKLQLLSKLDNNFQQDFTVSHAVDTQNKSKDIKLENFSISIGKVDLMVDCNVTLAYGRRYALIGRNGSGKTTLLKAIVRRELDGIPSHLRIMHVVQEAVGDETTVLDSVLKADVERDKLLQEEKQILKETSQGNTTNSFRLQKIYERLQMIDANTAEARASSILAGLGYDTQSQQRATKEFSGGWRMRIALARALFCKPDILLLDEPTNHLDLFSCLWLENYLQNWKGTLLIVSHQRDFINAVATDILHLINKKIDLYKGNFDAFEQAKYEKILLQQRTHEAQQKQVKHIQQFIDRFRYNAKRASLVQSRLKQLAKMQLVDEVILDPTLVINFPEPEELIPPILQFWDVSFKYNATDSDCLFKNLNLGIDMDSRVALLGANGVGKSTLLKLMSGELEPTTGQVIRNQKLRFAKFSQHFVDQLADFDVSPLEHFMALHPGIQMQTVRNHLGSFGLSGDLALRSISALSGGQKSRLIFAILAWKKPHVLLLDEPTNHLDIETIDSLCQALGMFKGGVLLVSHDERLISIVCDQLWYMKDQTVHVFEGEFSDYKKMLLENVLKETTIRL